MIVLFCDFGAPYLAQMKAAVRRAGSDAEIVTLFSDAPAYRPKAGAYLLPAYVDAFAPGSVFLCVVDPGVGSERGWGALKAGGRWFVGPDNGLFEMVIRRADDEPEWWAIKDAEGAASATFHGRDLFAPAAACISMGDYPQGEASPLEAARRPEWPDELAEIIYIDCFGNAVTGIRALSAPPDGTLPDGGTLLAGGKRLGRARTFSDVPAGEAFWYENANGLVEIAVNSGRADSALGLAVGTPVQLSEGT